MLVCNRQSLLAILGVLVSLEQAGCVGGSSTLPLSRSAASASVSISATPTPPPLLSGAKFRYYGFYNTYPMEIMAGADSNVWFTQSYLGEVGKITPSGQETSYCVLSTCPNSGLPIGLARGKHRTLWFANRNDYSISNVSLTGVFLSRLPSAPSPRQIADGSDGNLWFTQDNPDTVVGRMTPGGMYTGFPVSKPVGGIISGPDGNLWFSTGDGVLKMTTAGISTFYPGPSGVTVTMLGVGSDGKIWAGTDATPNGSAEILRITIAGSYKIYAFIGYLGPTHNHYSHWQTTALHSAHGFVYFAEQNLLIGASEVITQVSTGGHVAQQYSIPVLDPNGNQYISSITRGADGNLWFVDAKGQSVDVWVLNAR